MTASGQTEKRESLRQRAAAAGALAERERREAERRAIELERERALTILGEKLAKLGVDISGLRVGLRVEWEKRRRPFVTVEGLRFTLAEAGGYRILQVETEHGWHDATSLAHLHQALTFRPRPAVVREPAPAQAEPDPLALLVEALDRLGVLDAIGNYFGAQR